MYGQMKKKELILYSLEKLLLSKRIDFNGTLSSKMMIIKKPYILRTIIGYNCRQLMELSSFT